MRRTPLDRSTLQNMRLVVVALLAVVATMVTPCAGLPTTTTAAAVVRRQVAASTPPPTCEVDVTFTGFNGGAFSPSPGKLANPGPGGSWSITARSTVAVTLTPGTGVECAPGIDRKGINGRNEAYFAFGLTVLLDGDTHYPSYNRVDRTHFAFSIGPNFDRSLVKAETVRKGGVHWQPGDTGAVMVNSRGKIEYYHNGELLHTSQFDPKFPLYGFATVHNPGDGITCKMITSEAAEARASNEAYAPTACTSCSADGGACYSKLSLPNTFNWSPSNASATNFNDGGGWVSAFERDEKSELAGPPNKTVPLLNFKGVADQVTFRLAWGPNPSSGNALPLPPAEGIFHVLDYAHTGGTTEEQHNIGDRDFTDWATTTPYAIGETYKFAPVEIIAAEHTDDVLSELEFSLKDAPEGFLINPTDGYIQGTPTARGEHTMQLYAVDSLNNRALTLLQTAVEDAGVATTSNATSGGAGKTSKKKKKKKKTSTTKADQRQAVAVNDTYMSDAPAEATRAGSRQSVAVNDTYMTDEPTPAEEMADQYLTVDNAGGAVDAEGEAGADDEYLSVAAGLHNGTIDDGLDSGSDIEL
eukprot:gene16882-14981_t